MKNILWIVVTQCVFAIRPYDVGFSSFSPDGALHQLEYAQEASNRGELTIGIQTDKAVVLICAKNSEDPLRRIGNGVDEQKFFLISSSLGCAASGFVPDCSMMVAYGRERVLSHWFSYGEIPSVKSTATEIAELALSFSSHHRMQSEVAPIRMSRPCGATLLIVGVDSSGPALYHVDPLGSVSRWRAKAIGKQWDIAETELKRGLEKLEGEMRPLSLKTALRLAFDVFEKISNSHSYDKKLPGGSQALQVAIARCHGKPNESRFEVLSSEEIDLLLE